MRTIINNALGFLREHRNCIPDSMIKTFEITEEFGAVITLVFANEEEIAKFGATHLPAAHVEKLARLNESEVPVIYSAKFSWKKRPLHVYLEVRTPTSIPASRLVSFEDSGL